MKHYFVDEVHFYAVIAVIARRSKWVLMGMPALLDSNGPHTRLRVSFATRSTQKGIGLCPQIVGVLPQS